MKQLENAIHLLQTQTNIQHESFVITTEDAHVIVVDGGHRADAPYLIDYLKGVTGEDVPFIDAWILTHPHDDHVDAFFEIIENHKDEVNIGRVMFNIPSIKYYAEEEQEADVFVKITKSILLSIFEGDMTLQRAFMSGQVTAKGDFKVLRNFDTMFRFS